MKKGLKIAFIILGAVLLIAIIAGTFGYFKYFSAGTDAAVLNIKEGDVQVDSGNGWVKADDGMALSLNDKVKTGEGSAMVVLYESVMVTLDPNTEVTIKTLSDNNVVVKQDSGSTWNKFSDLAGVKTYNVETPTTVATVRGTGFNVEVKGDESVIDVGEGAVDVKDDGNTLKVGENMRALKKRGEKAVQAKIGPEMRMRIAKKMVDDLQNMKDLRKREIMKHKDLIEQARKQYGFTDGQMYDYLDKIDSGEVNDEELIAKAPVRIPALQKLKKMNDNIKKQQAVLQKLDNEIDNIPDAEKLASQKLEIKNRIRAQLKQKIINSQQNIADAKQQIQARLIDASQKLPDTSEKTITDSEIQKQEEINKGTATAY